VSDFVLDASVALAWVLDNPIPAYALDVRRALEMASADWCRHCGT